MRLINSRPGRWTLIAVAALVLISVPVVAQIQFSDVEPDNPHRTDINYVAGERWFIGYGDGTYKPDQNISPSEMTKVLSRAFDEGITRAEFASFLVAGNHWRQQVKETPGFQHWTVSRDNRRVYIVRPLTPDEGNRELIDGIYYIKPGRYRLDPYTNHPYSHDQGCRWMRLGFIPTGGQNFDTIAATDAPLAVYFQGDYTREQHIITIEPTDAAFQIDCD